MPFRPLFIHHDVSVRSKKCGWLVHSAFVSSWSTRPAVGGDSCRNGNTRDAGTLKNYNFNVHQFEDITKKNCDKMLYFLDETISQLKSSKMKV